MVIIIMMIKFMVKIMILLPMVMISSSLHVTFRAIGKKRRMKFVIYHGETEKDEVYEFKGYDSYYQHLQSQKNVFLI